MAITVKHTKVSTIPDGDDSSLIRPSDWNDDHVLTGTIPVANGGTGASTLTGYVKGNGTAAMTASATVPNTDVTGLGTMSTQNANNVAITGGTMSGVTVTGYIPTSEKAQPLGVATLDAGGKVPTSQIPMQGDLNYQGTWNATTNTPTLTSSVGTQGYYYVVSVAGTTNLNGITDWQIGDWAIYNGSVWQKVDNTDAVSSVNGQVGTVVLTQADISGTVPTTRTITAGTGLTGGGDLSADRTFAIDSTVATLTGTQTLTNKTLTSPKVNEILDANGNEVLGLLSTASATDYVGIKNGIGVGVPLHISSEGSSTNIGLHIQPKGSGLVTISDGTDFNKGIRFRSSGSAASAITLLDAVATAGRVVTLPDATTTLVGRDTTDTLTNKSISGSTNTLSNIGNASLTNSAITINGTSTSLGGSISVGTVTSVDLTASTGISVSGGPITGSGSITVTNTAPDQVVSITGGGTTTVTGTYPNFTVSSDDQFDGTVTSVGGTGTVNGITLTGTVTSSGSLTLGGTLSGVSLSTQVTGTLPIANGGTGETTRQAAMDALAGAVTSGQYLRGNGTDVVMSAIQVADVPTLNQNTTGTASNVTGTVAVANGGTGLTSLTANRVPYGNGTSALGNEADFNYDPSLNTLTAPQVNASNGIIVNSNTVSASYTIPSGSSAMSAGPMTVTSGQTVTVSSGSRWVIL
tara:strand:- start:2338 stop:4413 length:2076 start_codon:yes stop_codon:yes gene_type:complete